ncbi:MAG: hypothetical protein A2W19_03690 [Spirochaetes bacterium RBG_16_49_21]|nr:MAG: hypothetical protein A2W19_03690 [Spirochaetes bacterium RBG_16_49_21]
MKRNRTLSYLLFMSMIIAFVSCVTSVEKKLESENQEFLKAPFNKLEDKETFRVTIDSDKYIAVQTDYEETIQRENDPGGDRYICDEIKKYDKIDEAREGMYQIFLYPDRGTLKRVRPYKPLNLIELDNLILEDLQRWTFRFPRNVIQPSMFYIKYRIVLRKRQSDEQIIQEVQKKMSTE